MTVKPMLERRFVRLNRAVRERLPFSTVKILRSLSTVFEEGLYHRLDQRRVVVEFQANGEKSCPDAGDTSEEMACDKGHESVEVYLALSGVRSQNYSSWRRGMRMVELVSVPDSVEEISEECFSKFESLSRVTFGESSSLKLIAIGAFFQSGICEIHIPDGVQELCEMCFFECGSLSRVTFGESSSLKLIGKQAFSGSGLVEIHIPDSVKKICEGCFAECESLSRVILRESSSLAWIGKEAFRETGVVEIHIPDGVEKIREKCFFKCNNLSRVTLGEFSRLKTIKIFAFDETGVDETSLLPLKVVRREEWT